MDLELLCQNTLARQRELLDEAVRRRLLSGALTTGRRRVHQSGRMVVAAMLRKMADRLERPALTPQLGVLRAVGHREVDVEQGLWLLEDVNGRRARQLRTVP